MSFKPTTGASAEQVVQRELNKAAKNVFLQNYRQQQSLLHQEETERSVHKEKEKAKRRETYQRMIFQLLRVHSGGGGDLLASPRPTISPMVSPRENFTPSPQSMAMRSYSPMPPMMPALHLHSPEAFYDDPIHEAMMYSPRALPPLFAQRMERLTWRREAHSPSEVQVDEKDGRYLIQTRELYRRKLLESCCIDYLKLVLHDLAHFQAHTQPFALPPSHMSAPEFMAGANTGMLMGPSSSGGGGGIADSSVISQATVVATRPRRTSLVAQISGATRQPFTISPEVFTEMVERKDVACFAELGGIPGVIQHLNTHPQHGIEPNSIVNRIDKYGINQLPPPEEVTFWGLVKEALEDQMMRILMAAAMVSLVLNLTVPDPRTGHIDWATGWIEGAAIWMSVIVNVFVGAGNDYKKAQQFRALNAENEKRDVTVIRDGEKVSVDVSRLVVGDLLCVEGGDMVPADAILVEGQDVQCDESAATGETDTIEKRPDTEPFMISGTNVLEGLGRAVVVAVGPNSFSGKLTLAARGEAAETPLQEQLTGMADQIGTGGLWAAILTVVVLSLKELFYVFFLGHPIILKHFLEYIIVAITIVVVAIPEGLPLAVTIALAYSMKNMMTDNCLVRVLAACETMGGATAICSDKTGTLTTNKMTVVQGWIADKSFVVPDMGIQPRPDQVIVDSSQEFAISGVGDDATETLTEALSYNTTAEIRTNGKGERTWVGNKTEFALLQFLQEHLKGDFMRTRSSVPRKDLRVYPFSSQKKHMTTLLRQNGNCRLYCKGAPEILLPLCTQYVNGKGESIHLSDEKREFVKEVIVDMASQGNRIILMSYSVRDDDVFPDEQPNPQDLILITVIGIQDPIRPEVPRAVAQCQKAGITVRMVTGDNKQTAISIAEKCGIYQKGKGIAMEGKEFRQLAANDPAGLKQILPDLQILARSSPGDKNVLVDFIHKLGHVVAVTGDGTNDAPALKKADVGFAMKSGTEIARNASDMIILDDNFVSVVKATMWGRNVNDNIRKFLQFQVTVNIVGVALTFIGAAASATNTSPLSSVQLLWLNLIMDTLAALALATEQPSETVLDRPPRPKTAPLISHRMWINIGGQAIFMLFAMLALLNYGADYLGIETGSKQHSTIVFNSFIMMQIFNEFNARKLYNEVNVFSGIDKSFGHLFIAAIMVFVQWFAVQVAGDFMNTVPLSLNDWLFCIGVGSITLPLSFFLRMIPCKEPTYSSEPEQDTATGKLDLRYADQTGLKLSTAISEHRSDSAAKVIRSRGSSIRMRKSPSPASSPGNSPSYAM